MAYILLMRKVHPLDGGDDDGLHLDERGDGLHPLGEEGDGEGGDGLHSLDERCHIYPY